MGLIHARSVSLLFFKICAEMAASIRRLIADRVPDKVEIDNQNGSKCIGILCFKRTNRNNIHSFFHIFENFFFQPRLNILIFLQILG